MTNTETVSTERLREILAGLEGVTPGPWVAQDVSLQPDDVGSAYIVGANLGGLVGGAHAWPSEIDDGDFERVEANAAHIARCDPDTIRSIITELLASRTQEPADWQVEAGLNQLLNAKALIPRERVKAILRAASITPPSQEPKGDARGEVEGLSEKVASEMSEGKTGRTAEWMYDIAKEAAELTIAALNPRKETAGVTVKPLDWRPIGPEGSDVEADTSIGIYTLSFDAPTAGGAVNLWVPGDDADTFTVHENRKEAIAAAQADYDARIRAALSGDTP